MCIRDRHRAESDAAAHQGRNDLRRRGPGAVPDANGRAAAVAEGSKLFLLRDGAGSLKEGFPMNELKGNFKAAYDVLKRAERCVLLRSKAANPLHTYAAVSYTHLDVYKRQV